MADMTFQQIEEAAGRKLPVLFPIAVIEEHGPHMCLGTDTYLTYNFARDVRKGLLEAGVESIIAPPYYWGINAAMSGFAGSFTVRPETMVAILRDLLTSMKNWGFERIFLLSVHGDFEHSVAMTDAARWACEHLEMRVCSAVNEIFVHRARLSGKEPYIIIQPMEFLQSSPYLDIHAGAFETSLMADQFPGLVDIEAAQKLTTSGTTTKDLKTWLKGGEKAREVTPQGYLGDPSAIDIDGARRLNARTVNAVVKAILESLKTS